MEPRNRPDRTAGRLAGEEKILGALDEFEEQLVERQLVPDTGKLTSRRFAPVLQFLVALVIGILVGTGSVFVGFILFSMILHL